MEFTDQKREDFITLFNLDTLKIYSTLNPYHSISTHSISLEDLHFEKKDIEPSSDSITYFEYETREGEKMYLLYLENRGLFLFYDLLHLFHHVKYSKTPYSDSFPMVKHKHLQIAVDMIDIVDNENIKHYKDWLKFGHIESNYHYEDIVSDEKERRPMITFQPKQPNSLPKKQIIDSFYYLIITKTFYSIFYYSKYEGYKIYNGHLSNLPKSERY